MFERTLEENKISNRVIQFSSSKSLRGCLQRGLGISVCPVISIEQELKEGSLVQLNARDIIEESPVLMIYHIDKWCSSLLKLFMDLTKKIIR